MKKIMAQKIDNKQKALQLLQAGKLSEAKNLYQQMLASKAVDFDICNNLGIINCQQQQFEQAIILLKQALDLKPNDYSASYNLACAYQSTQQTDLAIKMFQQVLKFKPDYLNALYSLGLIHKQYEQYSQAKDCFQQCLQIDTKHLDSHNQLAGVLNLLGDKVAAVKQYQRLLELSPKYLRAYNDLGAILISIDQKELAIKYLLKVIDLEPNYILPYYNLSGIHSIEIDDAIIAQLHRLHADKKRSDKEQFHICASLGKFYAQKSEYKLAEQFLKLALQKQSADDDDIVHDLTMVLRERGKYAKARTLLENKLKQDPNNIKTLKGIGLILKATNHSDLALTYFKKCVELDPEDIDNYENLGEVLHFLGHTDEAIECYRKILELKPNYEFAYSKLCNTYMTKGDKAKAIEYLRKAITLKPKYIFPYYDLMNICDLSIEDPICLQLKKLDVDDSLPDDDKILLNYSLGKMYDNSKEFDKSFVHYRTANNLNYQKSKFSIIDYQKLIDKYIVTFTKEWLSKYRSSGIINQKPVFIVGMPRSGTTIAEQILSSHSAVFGAGELHYIAQIQRDEQIQNGYNINPQLITPDKINSFAKEYLDYIGRIAPEAQYVVDKMPHNFQHLWLITLMFPQAKIIHCRRNPIDTCLSCYFVNFPGHRYSNDLEVLGLYYKQYLRLMTHWQKVIDCPIFELNYEQLIDQPEIIVRQLLDFCQLPWENNCLEFYNNDRPVLTASKTQVRQKLYSSSVGRWQRYKKADLQPLTQALDLN